MNYLGWLCMKGWGVAQDYDEAREWYQKAADAGLAMAMNNLGWLYMNGRGVAQDYGKAREWYQKAADAGLAQAKEALSLLRLKRLFGFWSLRRRPRSGRS
jgi:TPR repeat protein